jgi:hypothetical protein
MGHPHIDGVLPASFAQRTGLEKPFENLMQPRHILKVQYPHPATSDDMFMAFRLYKLSLFTDTTHWLFTVKERIIIFTFSHSTTNNLSFRARFDILFEKMLRDVTEAMI